MNRHAATRPSASKSNCWGLSSEAPRPSGPGFSLPGVLRGREAFRLKYLDIYAEVFIFDLFGDKATRKCAFKGGSKRFKPSTYSVRTTFCHFSAVRTAKSG